jgi:hypothetical protein
VGNAQLAHQPLPPYYRSVKQPPSIKTRPARPVISVLVDAENPLSARLLMGAVHGGSVCPRAIACNAR